MENLGDKIYVAVEEGLEMIREYGDTRRQDVCKRLYKHFYKAATTTEATGKSWEECTKSFVEKAFQGYASTCDKKDWFYAIDFSPAFACTVWEVLGAQRRLVPKVSFQRLSAFVRVEVDELLHRKMVDDTVYEVVVATFPDHPGLQSKLNNALYKAYTPSLQLCLARPYRDSKSVEIFLKYWMDDSMRRAWASMENAGVDITENLVAVLFRNLISPFGNQVPFSCVPVQLTNMAGGPPPREWKQIRTVTRQVLAAWEDEGERSAKRKKCREQAEAGTIDDGVNTCRAKEEEEFEEDEEKLAQGHELCTSVEDCVGSQEDRLVRHMADKGDGDVYCETCWRKFVVENPALEACWEDSGVML